jgi:peptidoglycan/xylan/chitin deacetylase (PgdA/CDA1 family)
MLALTGALGAGSAASLLFGTNGIAAREIDDPEAEPAGVDTEDDNTDEEMEDPAGGWAEVIWSVPTNQPVAALTFDDGPDPEFTPRILDILARHDVQATFLAMGHNAQEHPGLLRQVRDAGHEIGHHSWRHLNMAHIGVGETREEFGLGMMAVAQATGTAMRWFRPPRGRMSETVVKLAVEHGQSILQWSVNRGPLDERTPGRIADHIVGEVGPGDIVLLHDGIGRGTFKPGSPEADELRGRRSSEVEALPEIIQRVRAGGIQLATVSALMTVRSAART